MSSNATTQNETSNVTSLPSTSKAQTAKEVIAANVKLLIEQLEAGHSEGLTAYLTAMGRFHNYSFGNILEIARQKPDATHVAGMYAWNQLGRKVIKGQKGIRSRLHPPVPRQRRTSGRELGSDSAHVSLDSFRHRDTRRHSGADRRRPRPRTGASQLTNSSPHECGRLRPSRSNHAARPNPPKEGSHAKQQRISVPRHRHHP